MARARRRIDSALKAKIALDALRGQKSIADLALQYGLHPNQIYAYKKQLQTYAVYAFDRPTRQIAELQPKRAVLSAIKRPRTQLGTARVVPARRESQT